MPRKPRRADRRKFVRLDPDVVEATVGIVFATLGVRLNNSAAVEYALRQIIAKRDALDADDAAAEGEA